MKLSSAGPQLPTQDFQDPAIKGWATGDAMRINICSANQLTFATCRERGWLDPKESLDRGRSPSLSPLFASHQCPKLITPGMVNRVSFFQDAEPNRCCLFKPHMEHAYYGTAYCAWHVWFLLGETSRAPNGPNSRLEAVDAVECAAKRRSPGVSLPPHEGF